MAKSLVIVESAAKAKTIQKYLNSIGKGSETFTVVASLGHINDLPKKTLGVDKTTWEATYELSPEKSNIIKKIRREIKDADKVYLATDPDMEGEAIAFHLAVSLKLKNPVRIMFREITRDALQHALTHPTRIDAHVVNAQEARRILDRIVGYELSPLLWKHFTTPSLSAGRVQSAALKILVDNLIDAKSHTPTPYWKLQGEFIVGSGKSIVKTVASSLQYDCEEDALNLLKHVVQFSNNPWRIHVTIKESKRNPSAPFVTSTLQQEAYNKLGLSAKRTMQEAQALYEDGFITYMRTDSPALSAQAQHAITKYIKCTYGESDAVPRQYKAKAANAQQAHECIRPTKVDTSLPSTLEGVRRKLFELIWRRSVASQMKSATYLEAHIECVCEDLPNVVFHGTHEMLLDEGYLKVWSPDIKPTPQSEIESWIHSRKELNSTPVSFVAAGDVSRPPTMFNEPMLVRTLEKLGIGRPSTYAATIDKLLYKGYVVKGASPYATKTSVPSFIWAASQGAIQRKTNVIEVATHEKDKLVPTDLGERVVEFLVNVVPDIVNARFTAHMETALDQISEGHATKSDVLNTFYLEFDKALSPHKDAPPAVEGKNTKCFPSLGICVKHTKYGLSLFRSSDKKYVSLAPFLSWRGKTIDEITERDASFLMSFPLPVTGTTRMVAYGMYGLYVKDGTTNIRLAKKYWDAVYEGTISPKVIVDARAEK